MQSKLQANKIISYTFVMTVVIALWHIIIIPFWGLGVDEAHYALYALNLNFGYFDHPPLVGWLLSPLQLFKSDIVARLITWLLIFSIHWLIYLQSYKLFKKRSIALLALSLFSLNPMVQLLWFGIVPDTPLIICLLLLIFILPPLSSNDDSTFKFNKSVKSLGWKQASLLGVMTGLAGLSKFNAILIPISWLLDGYLKYWWKQASFYWALLIALLTISPFLFFLWQTDLASFTYQFNHVVVGGSKWFYIFTWPLVQLISYGPLLVILLPLIIFLYWRELGWLKFYIILLLIGSIFSASNGNLLPHWTVSLYSVAVPYIAHYIYHQFLSKARIKMFWLWVFIINIIPITLLVVFISLATVKPHLMPVAMQHEFKDWDKLAQWSVQLKNNYQADAIWVRNWTQVSRLAWYAHPQPVVSLDEKNKQFTWWYGAIAVSHQGVLILINDDSLPSSLDCRYIDKFSGEFQRAQAYLCSGFSN